MGIIRHDDDPMIVLMLMAAGVILGAALRLLQITLM